MRTGSFIRFSYNEILFHFEWLADSGALDHQDRGINKEFDVSTEDMNEIIAGKNVEKVILSKIQSGQIISQDMLLSSLLHSLNFIVFDYGDFDYYSYDYDTIEDCSEFIHLLCQLEDYIGGKIRIRRMEVNNLQKSILPTFKYLDFEPLTLKFEYCDGYDMHPDFEDLTDSMTTIWELAVDYLLQFSEYE
uniref:Uncharacterized protein n=1 Tax=Acrobeloides nanus TaxID=290746 RepID=A0A914C247_9BILA